MKYKHLLPVLALALTSFTTFAIDNIGPNKMTKSGVITIEWDHPQNYSDVKAVGGRQGAYEVKVFQALTDNLAKVAKKTLKSGLTLELIVTNLDLAGDVQSTFGATPNDIRVV